jgi:glutathione S-transferase
MKILSNTTSPFARVARIALIEKGLPAEGLRMMNPWTEDADMARLNPASRVPTLELPSGLPLTESLLILMWLEKTRPEPSLLGSGADIERIMSKAGLAMGVIEAMANLVTGRMQIDPAFEGGKVGRKRVGTVVEGFWRLEADPPAYVGGVPDLSVLTAVVAVDYLALRFPDHPWVEPIPKLGALRDAVSGRPAYAETKPYL